MGYKALGYVVFQGAKWYARRRYGNTARLAAAGVVGAAVIAALAAGGRKAASGS